MTPASLDGNNDGVNESDSDNSNKGAEPMKQDAATAPLNSGRQMEIDLARGLAVLFMIIIHFQEYFLMESYWETGWALTGDFFGSVPAAPVFMFLLGVGIVYSRHQEAGYLARRGGLLLGGAYLLNILRGLLPCLIVGWQTGDPEEYAYAWETVFFVDILQFAGLALLTFALFRRLRLNNWLIALAGLGLALLNYPLLGIQSDNLYFVALTGLIWGSGEVSYFPYLSWIFYPIAGYLFGGILIRSRSKIRLYALCLLGGGLVWFGSALGLQEGYGIDIGLFSDYSYYHHTLLGNVAFTGFILWWLSALFFLFPLIPKFAMQAISRWSYNVTYIYVAQWLIIGWLVIPFYYWTLEPPMYFVYMLLVIVASDAAAHYFRVLRARLRIKII